MISRLLAPFVGYIASGLILALAFGSVQTWRIGRLKFEANVAAGQIKALGDAKTESERLRGLEGDRSAQSFTDLQSLCLNRLSSALSAGRTIERVVNAPAKPDGSRGLCDAECLRSIVGEAGSDRKAGTVPN